MAILKYIIGFFIVVNISYAYDLSLAKKNLIENITSVFVKDNLKKIYINSYFFNDIKNSFNYPYKIVESCQKADICFVDKIESKKLLKEKIIFCLLYTSPSPRDRQKSRMPSSA
jgi:predicted nucleic acid binding AN1-type Zn finger protein